MMDELIGWGKRMIRDCKALFRGGDGWWRTWMWYIVYIAGWTLGIFLGSMLLTMSILFYPILVLFALLVLTI